MGDELGGDTTGGKKRKRTGENSGPVQEKPKKKMRLKI